MIGDNINLYSANKIRELREKNNLTQQQLANKLNINQQNLARYELNQRIIKIDFLLKLCEIFNVNLDYFIPFNDNISPVEIDKVVIKIPVLGVIPAGVPIEAIEEVLDYEEIPKDWCKSGKEFFGLKIKGDSMFPKYIDNDVVIFEKTNDFNNGDECAVMVNGDDCTFKKVLKHDHGITLQPLNSAYDIKMYSNEDIEKLPIKIIGVAKEMRRKL